MNGNGHAPCHFSHRHTPLVITMRVTLPAFASLTLGILLSALSGCDHPPDLSTEAAGHTISARIRGSHTVVSENGYAVITGPFAKVTIERAQVKVNDGRWTTIPEGVPVSLDMARSSLRIQAGNVTITHSVQ